MRERRRCRAPGGSARPRRRRCRPAAWWRSRRACSADVAARPDRDQEAEVSRCIWRHTSSAIRTSAECENAAKSRSETQRPGVVGLTLVAGVDRVEHQRGGAAWPRPWPAPGSAATSGYASSMITVQAQCGCRSAGARGGPVDRPHLRLRVGGDGGRVEGRVLDVVAHRAHVVGTHRLDVHQGTAVVEVELAVPAVVHRVAEVHELRGRPDVELEPLEDRHHVAAARRGRGVPQRLLHPPCVDRRGRGPLLDGDLGHLLAAERRDAPRHAGAVDQLPDQQQLGHQRRELVPGEVGVPASQRSAHPSSTAHAAPSCPACRARSAAAPRWRSPAWAPAPTPCAP